MKTTASIETKVGIVTFSAIALFIIAIAWANGFNFGTEQTVVFKVPASSGIEVGAPITVQGVKRGAVVAVRNSADSVIIEGTFDSYEGLFADAKAQIMMLEITGGKKIEMSPGSPAASPLAPGDTIRGTLQPDIADVMGIVADIADEAAIVLRRADSLVANANGLLNTPEFQQNIITTVEELRNITQQGNALLSNNYQKIERVIDNLDKAVVILRQGAEKYEPRLDTLLRNVETLLADTKKTVRSADTVIASVNDLTNNVNGIVTDIKTNKGTANKLLYDEKFARELDSALKSIEMFIEAAGEVGINVNLGIGHKTHTPVKEKK